MTLLDTAFCTLMQITTPVVQAPIGSASCPELAAAVSNAGGLGMLALTWCSPEPCRALIRQTRMLTSRPFGINLILDPAIESVDQRQAQLETALEEGVALISLAWATPSQGWVAPIHAAGSKVAWTVWDREQAEQAVAANVDILVLQGNDAGGHLNSSVPAHTLLEELTAIPVRRPMLVAGGIANGRDLARAIGQGAAGVWIGTRFVASAESHAHGVYKDRIVSANAQETFLSTLYNKGWPRACHRTLKNRTWSEWHRAGEPPEPNRPGEYDIIAYSADGSPITRYEDTIPLEGMRGNLEELALYAGESSDRIERVMPAGEIMDRLVAEALSG